METPRPTEGPRPHSKAPEAAERALAKRLADAGLDLLGVVPEDEEVRRRDLRGEPLADVPEEAPARRAVEAAARALGAPR